LLLPATSSKFEYELSNGRGVFLHATAEIDGKIKDFDLENCKNLPTKIEIAF